jgi:hypothetical protein
MNQKKERRLDALELAAEAQRDHSAPDPIPAKFRESFTRLVWKILRREPTTEADRAEWDKLAPFLPKNKISDEQARMILDRLVPGCSTGQGGSPAATSPEQERQALRELIDCLKEDPQDVSI